jgi:hypothetical protein
LVVDLVVVMDHLIQHLPQVVLGAVAAVATDIQPQDQQELQDKEIVVVMEQVSRCIVEAAVEAQVPQEVMVHQTKVAMVVMG